MWWGTFCEGNKVDPLVTQEPLSWFVNQFHNLYTHKFSLSAAWAVLLSPVCISAQGNGVRELHWQIKPKPMPFLGAYSHLVLIAMGLVKSAVLWLFKEVESYVCDFQLCTRSSDVWMSRCLWNGFILLNEVVVSSGSSSNSSISVALMPSKDTTGSCGYMTKSSKHPGKIQLWFMNIFF